MVTPGPASLPAWPASPTDVDVVVVGLGITGAGVALDAVTRGLTVLAVDAHDLAFGTSRWSSKLVHGGLRYLAQGQLAIAQESAVERGILMQVTAPHLVHALPMLTPLNDAMPRSRTAMTWGGLQAGDVLRRTARTSTRTLPRPRRLNATETLSLAPSMRAETLRGGLLAWDGQLEDDARLVVTVARTAASYGAEVRTRARVTALSGAPAPASSCATSSPASRTPSAPGRSSTRPACGPATSTTRSGCAPAAAPTSCCAAPRCRTRASR